MKEEPSVKIQRVSCPCGSEVRVNPLANDRRVTCPGCGSTFDFVITMDAARRTSRLSLVLTSEVLHTEGESLGAASAPARPEPPAPKPPPVPKSPTRVSRKAASKAAAPSGPTATCECGASFPLEDSGELTSMQSCPQCNRTYHVVFKIEHGTQNKVPIVVPGKPIVHRRTVPPSSTLPSAKDPIADVFTERRNRTKVSKKSVKMPEAKLKLPPPEIPPGAQGVPCPCGYIFVVRRRDIGSEMACQACGKKAVFEEARDYQTLAPIIRIRDH